MHKTHEKLKAYIDRGIVIFHFNDRDIRNIRYSAADLDHYSRGQTRSE